ncbi:uncharacterized protein [Penaeus vannamei]|uniref:uncharacterized protein n=1 Tax=Penaeus vannamei TaxID=6689 RepID=UPI00387FB153
MASPRLCVLLLLAAAAGTRYSEASFIPNTVEGRLVVPDTARIDNSLLKEAQADKFLSLWFIYVLADPVHTSTEPWTLLIPKNSGLPKSGGFLVDAAATRDVLLNHAILGGVVDAQDPPPTPMKTLSGTPVIFTKAGGNTFANGVQLTGEEYKVSDGIVYVIEGALPIGSPSEVASRPSLLPTPDSEPTTLPPLTHRFATFKPRRGTPSDINSVGSTKPELPFEAPDVEPVLAGETLGGSDISGGFAEFGPTAATPSSGFSEFAGSPAGKNDPFLKSFVDSLLLHRSADGAEFLHHFLETGINGTFRDTGRYTALVPNDSAFYKYYPIDWGFNPFLVDNFTKDVILNHFLRGNVALEDLPSLAEMTTLGGSTIKFTRRGNKLLANGVEVVLESESVFPRGRSYSIQELLFVDYERVEELLAQHGDLETAPLLGSPWPTSQFLSHLLERVEQDPRTTFFAEYLNYTNLAYLLPGSDDNLDPLKYTAFVPSNNALAGMLYADAPDPFQLDVVLRDNLILNHLVQGRLYEDDLQDGLTLSNLANNTFTVSRNPDGTIQVDNATVIESQVFIYNLGIVYLIDGVVGITDQDVVRSINKFPDLILEEPTEERSPSPDDPIDDLFGFTSDLASSPPSPPTTPRPFRTRFTPAPTSSRRPSTPRPNRPTTPTTTTTTTTTTTPTTTTTTPRPTPTTPKIRFETRTEISISRRVNDGQAEPVPVSES